uniref:DNA polymerase delta subunit 3 n=1 Tax=Rhizochromulina marina TaxID=1034831 RepID=A0A7S2RPT1_9STRA|mmetsp:Transcript_19312/g.56194  ORF Transcript_19312/g.56194 Transcript_19312/m.56194 type:complete len:465 (+) Transcript_19312:25-1419(+)
MAEYLEAIDAHVHDEQRLVTYRWLGSSLQLPSSVAQKALHDYCSQGKSKASGVYVVSGEVGEPVDNGSLRRREICLVPFAKLEDSKRQFSSVSSVHAFSAHLDLGKETNDHIYSNDVTSLAKEMFNSDSPSAKLYQSNRASGIRNDEVKLLPVGARPVRPSPPVAASTLPKRNPAAVAPPKISGNRKNLKPTSASAFFGAVKPKTKPSKERKAEDKNSAAEASTKPPSPKTAVKETKRKAILESDEEAEWDDSQPAKTSPNKKAKTAASKSAGSAKPKPESSPAKKRKAESPTTNEPQDASPVKKQIVAAPDLKSKDDEGLGASEPDGAETREEQHEKAAKTAEHQGSVEEEVTEEEESPEVKEPVSGAMDGFVKAPGSSASAEQKTKKTKKKLVERTSTDDKGYFVTESVWEDVTDDEADAPAPPAKSKMATPATKAKPKTPASKKGKSSGMQSSMLSFFKKK